MPLFHSSNQGIGYMCIPIENTVHLANPNRGFKKFVTDTNRTISLIGIILFAWVSPIFDV